VSFRSPTRIWKTAPYLPNISYSSSGDILNGRFLTYRMRLTSGGSRDLIYWIGLDRMEWNEWIDVRYESPLNEMNE